MKMPTPASEFRALPAGTHVATCFQVIDFGTQTDSYEGRETVRRKVWLGFEVPSEQMSDGRNFVIGKEYTFSSSPKSTFRKHLEAWRGTPFKDSDFKGEDAFDIKNLLSVGCMLSVTHNSNGRAVLNGIMKLPNGTTCPEPEKQVYLTLDGDEFDREVFDDLQDWMQDRIAESPEYQALGNAEESESPF
jgi:hypothetical protein